MLFLDLPCTKVLLKIIHMLFLDLLCTKVSICIASKCTVILEIFTLLIFAHLIFVVLYYLRIITMHVHYHVNYYKPRKFQNYGTCTMHVHVALQMHTQVLIKNGWTSVFVTYICTCTAVGSRFGVIESIYIQIYLTSSTQSDLQYPGAWVHCSGTVCEKAGGCKNLNKNRKFLKDCNELKQNFWNNLASHELVMARASATDAHRSSGQSDSC